MTEKEHPILAAILAEIAALNEDRIPLAESLLTIRATEGALSDLKAAYSKKLKALQPDWESDAAPETKASRRISFWTEARKRAEAEKIVALIKANEEINALRLHAKMRDANLDRRGLDYALAKKLIVGKGQTRGMLYRRAKVVPNG